MERIRREQNPFGGNPPPRGRPLINQERANNRMANPYGDPFIRKPLNLEHIERIREEIPKRINRTTGMCTFADGASLILDGVSTMFGTMDFFEIFKPAGEIVKVVKDVIDAVANCIRYGSHIHGLTLAKHAPSFKDYFYKVEKKDEVENEVEKTEIVFKRLTKTLASTCKVILWFAPHFGWLKIPQYISLGLGVTEIFFNRKNIFTENGKIFSGENMLKTILTLSYHVISCVIFSAMAVVIATYSCPQIFIISLGIPMTLGLVIKLVELFNWLVKKGMLDAILSLPQIDKLIFDNSIATKIPNITKFFIPKVLFFGPEDPPYRKIDLDKIWEHNFDMGVSFSRGIYLVSLGFQLCISAASELIASA
jgi:hypothetical protein